MHAIGKIAADPRTPRPLVEPVDVEPYIGQEAYNEIGHSYEAAVTILIYVLYTTADIE